MAGKIAITGIFTTILDLDEIVEEYPEGSNIEDILADEIGLVRSDPHGYLSSANWFEVMGEILPSKVPNDARELTSEVPVDLPGSG